MGTAAEHGRVSPRLCADGAGNGRVARSQWKGSQVQEPIPADIWRKAGHTLDKDHLPMGNLETPNNLIILTCMVLNCERKPEYLMETTQS